VYLLARDTTTAQFSLFLPQERELQQRRSTLTNETLAALARRQQGFPPSLLTLTAVANVDHQLQQELLSQADLMKQFERQQLHEPPLLDAWSVTGSVTGTSASADGAAADDADDDQEWQCSACTLLNAASALSCTVCQTVKPTLPLTKVRGGVSSTGHSVVGSWDRGGGGEDGRGEGDSASVPANVSMYVSASWACSQCTLHNSGERISCEACGAASPRATLPITISRSTDGEHGQGRSSGARRRRRNKNKEASTNEASTNGASPLSRSPSSYLSSASNSASPPSTSFLHHPFSGHNNHPRGGAASPFSSSPPTPFSSSPPTSSAGSGLFTPPSSLSSGGGSNRDEEMLVVLSPGDYVLVPRAWLQSWRRYLTDSRAVAPGDIDAACR
jgi:hypothetical protein